MNTTKTFLLTTVILFSGHVLAEQSDFFEGLPQSERQAPNNQQKSPLLRVKKKKRPGKAQPEPKPPKKSTKSTSRAQRQKRQRVESRRQAPDSPKKASLSLLLYTPLGIENTFDKRFASLGFQSLLSLPLSRLGRGTLFFLRFGLGLTTSRISLTQPSITFTHIFVTLPITAAVSFASSKKLSLQLFGGFEPKLFESDSRTTTDGGFGVVSDFFKNIEPELGAGLHYRLSQSIRLEVNASILYLSGGINIVF